eukprot:CAMPEP_0117577758 /NCGR_PEP_ID=MMETSP0784-20121206/63601_1 /TAXON_ID=39447 /ORGANISM="" /LENGTH=130 /DNA_ID=CAMNT_0005377297 /DNA_START=188 /DNA_END=576 /DNA_ORIENTATION=-
MTQTVWYSVTATMQAMRQFAGHSVELRIKRSEYSSIVVEETAEEDVNESSDSGADELERSTSAVELSELQLRNLPMQVSRLLLRSSSPLAKWRELTESFPAFTKSIVKSKLPSKKVAAELALALRGSEQL